MTKKTTKKTETKVNILRLRVNFDEKNHEKNQIITKRSNKKKTLRRAAPQVLLAFFFTFFLENVVFREKPKMTKKTTKKTKG